MVQITEKFVSPAVLFVTTWVIVVSGAALTPEYIIADRLAPGWEVFFFDGLLWVVSATLAFVAGTRIAKRYEFRFVLTKDEGSTSKPPGYSSGTLLVIYGISLAILFHLVAWILAFLGGFGSVGGVLLALTTDWHGVRAGFGRYKPFTGARLLYTGTIAPALCATWFFASHRDDALGLTRKAVLLLPLVISFITLGFVVLFQSQRILFVVLTMGVVITYILSGRDINATYPIVGGLVAGSMWIGSELLKADQLHSLAQSITYPVDKLLFYFYNNLGNATRSVHYLTEHAFGTISFRFVFRYLLEPLGLYNDLVGRGFKGLDGTIPTVIAHGRPNALGAPFMDYGWFGIALLFLYGAFSQILYQKSRDYNRITPVYGLVGGSILVSWHQQFWSNVAFWFNLTLIAVILWQVRR